MRLLAVAVLIVLASYQARGDDRAATSRIDYSALTWGIVHSHAFVIQNEEWPWTNARPKKKPYRQSHVPAGTIIKVGDCEVKSDKTGDRNYCSFVSEIGVSGRIRDDSFDLLGSGTYLVSLRRTIQTHLLPASAGGKKSEFSLERGVYVKLPTIKDVDTSWKKPSFLAVTVPLSSSPHWRRVRATASTFRLDQLAIGTDFRIIKVQVGQAGQVISFSPKLDPNRNIKFHRQPVAIWEHRLVTGEGKKEILEKISIDIGWLNNIGETASKVLQKFYDSGVKVLHHVSCASNVVGHTEVGLKAVGNALQLVGDLTVWKAGWSISVDLAAILKDGRTKIWVVTLNLARCQQFTSVFVTEPAYVEFTRIYVARRNPLGGTPKLVSAALTYHNLRSPTNTIDDEPPDFVVIENNENYRDARRYILQAIDTSRVSDELIEDEKVALTHAIIHTLGFFPSKAK